MRLEHVIEIIEHTDSDLFAGAIEQFNAQGIVTDGQLPFLDVVYQSAPEALCQRLASAGFKGRPQVTSGILFNGFVIYNAEMFDEERALHFAAEEIK
ncbi:hypothetical protein ACP3V5_08215 [Vibrio maritimus]